MKAAKTSSVEAAERPSLVDLVDSINLQSGNVIDLSRMLNAIGELMSLNHEASSADMFAGVAVVADVISDKVQAINDQANELYKAYSGDGTLDEKGA